MTQQAREVSEFGPWIDHFEQNATVHAHVDAAIDFDGNRAVARSGAASTDRVGAAYSSSAKAATDNNFCARPRRPVDPEYLRAAELFVAEEQQHAALLLRLLGYLRRQADAQALVGRRFRALAPADGPAHRIDGPARWPRWSRSRYYGGLAATAPTRWCVRWYRQWLRGSSPTNIRTSRFQQQRLRAGFADSGAPMRVAGVRLVVGDGDRRDGGGRPRSRPAARRDRISAHAVHPRRACRLRGTGERGANSAGLSAGRHASRECSGAGSRRWAGATPAAWPDRGHHGWPSAR